MVVRVQEDGLNHDAFVTERCQNLIGSRAKLVGPLMDLLSEPGFSFTLTQTVSTAASYMGGCVARLKQYALEPPLSAVE